MAKDPKIFIRAKTQSRVVGAEFERARERLSGETARGVSDIAAAARRTFIFFAPRASGRLQRGIRAHKSGWRRNQIDITATAVDPETGFDYVAVTRFGHRMSTIQPKDNLVLKLNFIGGFWTFAPQVKGYNPTFDWAEEALEASQSIARNEARRISQRLELRLL